MRNTDRILVVEDSVAVKKRLCMALENAGFKVETASNGKDAWQKTRRKQYDFVITDEQMPIMSGQQLCQNLRSDPRYAKVPIVFLTAAREKLHEDQLDVSAIFDKPFNPQLIVKFVDAYYASVVGR